MNRTEFLEQLGAARAEWEAAVASVPAQRLTEPGLHGGWSVKDTVAHVCWSERQMVGVIRQRALVGSPLWALDQGARNAAVYAENRDRPLADVIAEEPATWSELRAGLESLTDEDLTDRGRFPGMDDLPPGVLPWQIFAGSTFWHYAQHANTIRSWLAAG
jgi:uncharacterized damage-inducible protein DinB